MASQITIPRLGWNMDEGVFMGWIKKDGAAIDVDDPLFTLEADKATEDIPSLTRGTLHILEGGPKPGDKVAVGAVIGLLLEEGEVAASTGHAVPAAPGRRATEMVVAPANAHPARARPDRDNDERATASAKPVGPTASPRARRVAGEIGVDWTKLEGGGSTGRIRERDVRAFAAASQGAPGSSTRRRIAHRLQQSLRATVPVTLVTTADATQLVQLFRQLQDESQSSGAAAPTYTDLLVKLAAGSLQEHPHLNAHTDGERVQLCTAIHIGVAVDVPDGLVVPVVRDVTELSLQELAGRSRDLIARARQGKLKVKEMQGGTFTVSNLGGFGIDAFTPILNPPELAILGVGRIQRRPAVCDEQIVVRNEITLSLTFDHCAVDGAPAARFLQTLSERVEKPNRWLIP